MTISRHTQINLGLLDKVEECLQPSFSVDLGVENLAVFGNKFSGKSTLLKSIIIQLHNNNNVQERIIILDFGRALLSYNQLPLVYGYFSGENEESIKSCLNKIEEIIKKKNASVVAMHYTFIIDGIDDLFLEGKYERYQETFMNILRKKAKGKMSIIFTSYHSASGVVRLLQFFDNVIAFDLPKEKYEDLFPRKIEKPIVVSGRGVARKGESSYEFQAYYPFANKEHEIASEKSILSNITNKVYANFVTDKIKSFADELTETEYSKQFSPLVNEENFVAGVDYLKFEPIKFDLHDAGVIALYGTNFEDKLNLIQRIISHAKKFNPDTEVSLWDDSRSRFKDGLVLVDKIIENSEKFEAIFTPFLYDDIFNINKYNSQTGQDEPQHITLCKENKFTIYIIQNSRFFNNKPGSEGTQFAMRMCYFLQEAARLNYLFIFTNIKIQQGSTVKDCFNGCIKHAFLCGDIFQFIGTHGRNSVFGDVDSYELKQDFSRTVQGDGFYLDDESDYPQKIKFIVASQ